MGFNVRKPVFRVTIKSFQNYPQGSYASGKCQGNLNFFKVREFYVVSGKNEFLLKCQGNVREFYNIQFESNDEKQKMARAVF